MVRPESGEVPPVIQRWLQVIGNGETGEHPISEAERQRGEHPIYDLLAEDAVFYSPAVFTPQRGRALTAAYLQAAEAMFAGTGFHYVNQWYGPDSAVLEFAAEVDGLSVEGIDMIHWNDEGKIDSFKVMIRPFKALQGVIGRMAELLAAK